MISYFSPETTKLPFDIGQLFLSVMSNTASVNHVDNIHQSHNLDTKNLS